MLLNAAAVVFAAVFCVKPASAQEQAGMVQFTCGTGGSSSALPSTDGYNCE